MSLTVRLKKVLTLSSHSLGESELRWSLTPPRLRTGKPEGLTWIASGQIPPRGKQGDTGGHCQHIGERRVNKLTNCKVRTDIKGRNIGFDQNKASFRVSGLTQVFV